MEISAPCTTRLVQQTCQLADLHCGLAKLAGIQQLGRPRVKAYAGACVPVVFPLPSPTPIAQNGLGKQAEAQGSIEHGLQRLVDAGLQGPMLFRSQASLDNSQKFLAP